MRQLFPILNEKIESKPIIYFDNAATSQKPRLVIEAEREFYEKFNSNVHRSLNPLGEVATCKYEAAREKVKDFIEARATQEIIFVRNATEGLNLIAKSWGKKFLREGDRVVLTIAEHHSNIVPWLQLKEEIGIEIEYIPLDKETFRLDLEKGKALILNPRTKVVAVAHASNVLGAIHPIGKIIELARQAGAITIIDAAQSVGHIPVSVRELDCDFLVFSGHKMFAPTGIGVLYGKGELLATMPAWLGGGDMISEVFEDRYSVNELPYKFEAGTPNISGAIALSKAIEFIESIGLTKIRDTEERLTKKLLESLTSLDFIKIYGPKDSMDRLSIAAFLMDKVHPHDVADILGEHGICVRSGHHCAGPLHQFLNIPATTRASLAIFNTEDEIHKMVEVLKYIYKKFS